MGIFAKRLSVAILVFIIGAITAFVVLKEVPPEPLPVIEVETQVSETETIGTSVEGRKIEATTFGDGETHLVFVGGMHGGYEWNSTLLAYQFIDYLEENPSAIPNDLSVTVIPSANPDGLYEVTGKSGRFGIVDVVESEEVGLGRFNSNGVDLNRNFDCKWESESMWRGNVVSAGSEPFSEPETLAIRDFVLENNPDAIIFWHSQANTVYASECEDGILPETITIMNKYSSAAGYGAVESFDAYEITGDAEGWLASIGIPSITVELKTHETIEWNQNLRGIKELFKYYNQKARVLQ